MGKSLAFDEGMPRLEWQKVFLELTLRSCWVLLSNLVMSHKMFILSTSIDCMLIIFDEILKFLNWIIGKSSLITVSVPDPVVMKRSKFSKALWKISGQISLVESLSRKVHGNFSNFEKKHSAFWVIVTNIIRKHMVLQLNRRVIYDTSFYEMSSNILES